MDFIQQQLNNVKSAVVGPPVDPNTGQPFMQYGQPQEKKPWWKFGFGGARKKPKKTKTKKPKSKKTKRK